MLLCTVFRVLLYTRFSRRCLLNLPDRVMMGMEPVAEWGFARRSRAKRATRAAISCCCSGHAGDARSCSSPQARACSAHITSLFFRSFLLVGRRPWLVALLRRQRLPRPAPHTMLRIVFVAVDVKTWTLSDSLARRTGGSDSPLMRLLTFAPLSRCSLGSLGHGTRPPLRSSRPS